ncbi:MAG TPA: family 10 glycosylhydrolase [Armatimonadota bacterium]|nr:family 10 glycosylhydrolase [Armatimonadota bacterium]
MVPAPEPQTPPLVSPMQAAEPRRERPPAEHVRAVRFDAGYHYGQGLTARQLAEKLTRSWSDQGVNLVYFYAYNRVYGARYRTSYPGNIMEDYGRQDLLRHMIREAHRRGVKVVAWVQGVQHKQIWQTHPAWRQKNADGSDYKPDADSYFLCVRNPEVVQWWLGLLDELLTAYPDLDGIDLAEFQLDLWGDHACHCEHCRSQFAQARPHDPVPGDAWREFRADGLTRLLLASSRLAHSYSKEVHITTVLTARRDGKLMSSAQVRNAIGFDLEGVLSSPDRPDVLQAELIWQQWAAIYNDKATFTPEWTKSAVSQAKDMLRGRARLIAHVEVTDFGSGGLDGPRLAHTIASAIQGGATGIDIYDAHLLAKVEESGRYLETAWLDRDRQ